MFVRQRLTRPACWTELLIAIIIPSNRQFGGGEEAWGGSPALSFTEIVENVYAVSDYSERFEVPDVIGFRDIVHCAAAFASESQLRTIPSLPYDAALPFPYPSSPTKLRWFSIAQPEDLILLRTAAGRIVTRTDRLLSSNVLSHRLDQDSACWAFRNPKDSWSSFTSKGVELLKDGNHGAMCRTDIASYYPSIRLGLLASMLRNLRCDSAAVRLVMRTLRAWQQNDSKLGLPIGFEASSVLGNAFLKPIDDLIERLGVAHLRFGDDILLFADRLHVCESVLPALDSELDKLGLTRSIEKTMRFDDRAEAIENLRSGHLSSLGDFVRSDKVAGMSAVRRAFDEEILPGSASTTYFRWVINTLAHKNDQHACVPLAQNAELMNFDPRTSADYLKVAGLQDESVVDGVLERLAQVADDKHEGLDLHLLRVMSSRPFGAVEAKEFRRIATDPTRRWPIRNWAWHAYARTSRRYIELMEAARSEQSVPVRRAIVAATRGHATRTFMRHVSRNFEDCRFTSSWLEAA